MPKKAYQYTPPPLAFRRIFTHGEELVSDYYPDLNDVSDELSDDEGDYTSLHMFLAAHGLMDWAGKLTKERIDLDALMLLR